VRNPNLSTPDYAGLARFRSNAPVFVPVIRHLIDTMWWPGQKDDLRALILAMALPPSRKMDLLAKLDRQSLPR
jgi:hypothetical protein